MKPPEVIKLELFKSVTAAKQRPSYTTTTISAQYTLSQSYGHIVWDSRYVEANTANTTAPPHNHNQCNPPVIHPPPLVHLSSAPTPASGVNAGFRFVDPSMLSPFRLGGLLVRDSGELSVHNKPHILWRRYCGPCLDGWASKGALEDATGMWYELGVRETYSNPRRGVQIHVENSGRVPIHRGPSERHPWPASRPYESTASFLTRKHWNGEICVELRLGG